MSRLSKKTEDNDINRRMHRTFNDEPRHGCTRTQQKHDDENTLGNPLTYYNNIKGRSRMIEPSSQYTIDNLQIFMSRHSKKTEDDDINRRMHRTFSDEPRHGCTRSLEKHDKENTMANPLTYYSNRKGRARMIESSSQSLLGSTFVADLACAVETMIRRLIRVSSMLQDKLSSYGERSLQDHDDLAPRLAILKKL